MRMHWKSHRRDHPAMFRDPYLRWAEFTDWRAFKGEAGWDRNPDDDELVQIIARVDDWDTFLPKAKSLGLDIPSVYRMPVPDTGQHAKHFTAWVRRSAVSSLYCDAGFRWRLSQPMRDAERMARGSSLGRFGPERDKLTFQAKNVLELAVTNSAAPEVTPEKPTDVIAVIDFGCPFLNPVFSSIDEHGRRDDSTTRIVGLWDQGSSAAVDAANPSRRLPWAKPDDFGYGRELPPAHLTEIVRAVHGRNGSARQFPEETLYRGLDYLIDYDSPRRRVWLATHGAGVLDFAGGRHDPIDDAEDPASKANLIFVQLPSMTASDSSGASLGAHLLDGVRYVLAKSDPKARIVISISYGCRAGPQDGSSLIESALDELLELRPDNFAIVVSAGNARQQRAHVTRRVAKDRSAMLRCALAEGDTTDTFVEAWYSPPPEGWWIEARVRAVGGPWSDWLPPDPLPERGNTTLLKDDTGQCVAMLQHDRAVPNAYGAEGEGPKSLVLLAVAPTKQPRGMSLSVAPAGSWDVELRLVANAEAAGTCPPVEVLAQIERDDPGQNDDAQESRFRDPDAFDEQRTLSSLAWGKHTIVAGGCRLSDHEPVPYSSIGWRQSPEALPVVLAACERSASEPYLYAAAVGAEERFRMNGTSVAAPVLARQLFNAMGPGHTVSRAGWHHVIEALAGGGAAGRTSPRRMRMPGSDD